jgi:hypothetical protein
MPVTLTPDMKRIVDEQRLAFVATVDAGGAPNLSPKGTFVVLDDRSIAFCDIRSPATVANLAHRPTMEVNFVDPFVRKGYRFRGQAEVVARGSERFEDLIPRFERYGAIAHRAKAVVVLSIDRALPIRSPAYDDAAAREEEIRAGWTHRFRALQPGGRYVE